MRLRTICFLLFLAFYTPYLRAQAGIISTVAGGGSLVFQEGDPRQAPLGKLTSVAVDSAGNIYAADVSNRIVVRIDAFNFSLRIVFRLRPAAPTDPGSASLAVDNSGSLYISESEFNAPPLITRIDGVSGQTATIIKGGLNQPSGLAVDANQNLYVAEAGTDLIRRIAPDGTITTVAGNGTCGSSGEGGPATSAALCLPVGVAVDQAGNVYIADNGTSRILRVTADGTMARIAGNGQRGDTGDQGPALQAEIEPSGGIAVDAYGAVYFTQANRIREISADGSIYTLAGSKEANFVDGSSLNARFRSPQSLAVTPPSPPYVNVIIADTENWRVRGFTPKLGMLHDEVYTVAGNGAFGISGDGGPATAAALNRPYGLLFDHSGNLYYSDIDSHRVRKIDPNGIITTFAGAGRGFAGDGGPAAQALLSSPADLAIDAAGNVYIADSDNGRIRRVRADGTIQTIAGGGPPGATGDGIPATSAYLARPTGVAVDSSGNIYIADPGVVAGQLGQIDQITPDGIIHDFNSQVQLYIPEHVAIAPNGIDLYVTEQGDQPSTPSGGVLLLKPSGFGSGVVGGMMSPGGVTFDTAGKVLVSESYDYRVLRADTVPSSADTVQQHFPKATLVAGAAYGYGGDGEPATVAMLESPRGLAVDSRDNIYIADSRNKRIRAVSPGTPPPCSVSLPTTTTDVSGSAGTGGFNIAASSDCFWTATSNAWWISVTKGSGIGPGAVFFSIAGNLNVDYANHQSTPRTGTITVSGQTFTVTQEAEPASTGTFEPQLTAHLMPGYYIAEANLAQGEDGGFWGMEVLTSAGQTSGGFNLGGGNTASSAGPGFGAFFLASAQTVSAAATAPLAPQAQTTVELLDSNRQVIVPGIYGNSQFTEALQSGFYIVQVTSDSNSSGPLNFSLSLSADSFSGGLDTGGYIGPGITGFGAFYIPVEQDVTIHTFGKNTYGSYGAGSLILTLRDANRNVIQQAGP